MRETIIVLDTNFLLSCFDLQIDIMSEFERLFSGLSRLVTPYEVIEELKKLETTQKALASRARLALSFIDRHCEVIGQSSTEDTTISGADDVILSLAEKFQGVIATNDRELRKKSRALGISSVFLRERAYLESDRR
ncbi:MAG: PIN domain-containing protein [Candidatus Hodarchaeota archaeon]